MWPVHALLGPSSIESNLAADMQAAVQAVCGHRAAACRAQRSNRSRVIALLERGLNQIWCSKTGDACRSCCLDAVNMYRVSGRFKHALTQSNLLAIASQADPCSMLEAVCRHLLMLQACVVRQIVCHNNQAECLFWSVRNWRW